MNEQQLREALKETIALLVGIDQAIPGKIDAELVKFLQDAEVSEFTLSLLHRALTQVQAARQTRRTA